MHPEKKPVKLSINRQISKKNSGRKDRLLIEKSLAKNRDLIYFFSRLILLL